ncbi:MULTISPECIES: cystathionine beta-lyase [Rheinheimera]|uniref:Cystathionine beta-lyase n=1 Tax=Rheinheimera marina TaxID=1774958 RepID=A0ABV9JGP9_9GAMM
MRKATQLIHAGRGKEWTGSAVNPPVVRASTIVFDTMDELKHATAKRGDRVPYYGRRGTATHFALQEAICELEGSAGCALYPCGAAAINAALLTVLKQGDHLLMVDTAYEPTRAICDKLLAGLGIETTYYDPLLGAAIADLIRPNTKAIFLESPGSLTMEVQDIPAIAAVAKAQGICLLLDNTWGTPLLLDAYALGIDICIQSATKYIVGHSDAMLGIATANSQYWPQLREQSYLMGYCASADDAYLASRGLRTLKIRLEQHQANALKVANWLAHQDWVETVRHPALPGNPGHDIFKRDFTGSNGLFSFVLKQGDAKAVQAFIEGMAHFKMGFSWGGFESLIIPNLSIQKLRTASHWPYAGPLLRLHIGLEDPDDLIADLAAAYQRMQPLLLA